MYSPKLGRWLSPDPSGVAGGLNLYEYSNDDPVNWDDRSGLAPEQTGKISLFQAIINGGGVVRAGDVDSIRLTPDEVNAINAIVVAQGPIGSTYTADEIAKGNGYWDVEMRKQADRDFATLDPQARYEAEALRLNTERARGILTLGDPAFGDYTRELYKFVRAANPVHYVAEESFALGQAWEPVLNTPISRAQVAFNLLTYLAFLKVVQVAPAKVKGFYFGEAKPYAGVEFTNGGRLNVAAGYEPNLNEANAAVTLAEDGESVILKPPIGVRSPEGGTSDLYVIRDGKAIPFDVKTPTSADQNAVFRGIRNANDQAQGVVLDLRQTTVTLQDLGSVMARLQGSGGTNVGEVIVIQKDGTLVNLLKATK